MIYFVQLPDPLGLEAINRVRALRCVECGAECALRAARHTPHLVPGAWVFVFCFRCVTSTDYRASLEALGASLPDAAGLPKRARGRLLRGR